MCGTIPVNHCAANNPSSSAMARRTSRCAHPIAMKALSQLHWCGYRCGDAFVQLPASLPCSTAAAWSRSTARVPAVTLKTSLLLTLRTPGYQKDILAEPGGVLVSGCVIVIRPGLVRCLPGCVRGCAGPSGSWPGWHRCSTRLPPSPARRPMPYRAPTPGRHTPGRRGTPAGGRRRGKPGAAGQLAGCGRLRRQQQAHRPGVTGLQGEPGGELAANAEDRVDCPRGIHGPDGQAPPPRELVIHQRAHRLGGDAQLAGMHVHAAALPDWLTPGSRRGSPLLTGRPSRRQDNKVDSVHQFHHCGRSVP